MSGPTASQLRDWAEHGPIANRPKRIAEFDEFAPLAIEAQIERLRTHGPEIIALARERMLRGFSLYPDGPLFEMDADELEQEAREEDADAVVYDARRLALKNTRHTQPSP